MQAITTFIASLFITSSALAAPLSEREELILSLNQLTQIEASLSRAQQSARTGLNERYYFDYPRIHSDIAAL
ncbi:conjugal transfer protein, partial [Klebsiella aerogenes]